MVTSSFSGQAQSGTTFNLLTLAGLLIAILCGLTSHLYMPGNQSAVDIWLNIGTPQSSSAVNGTASSSSPATTSAISMWESFTTARRADARTRQSDCTPTNSSAPAASVWDSHIHACLEMQADIYKPHAQAWDSTLPTRLVHWTTTCSHYFRSPSVCAFCGFFKLGTRAKKQHNPLCQGSPYR